MEEEQRRTVEEMAGRRRRAEFRDNSEEKKLHSAAFSPLRAWFWHTKQQLRLVFGCRKK